MTGKCQWDHPGVQLIVVVNIVAVVVERGPWDALRYGSPRRLLAR